MRNVSMRATPRFVSMIVSAFTWMVIVRSDLSVGEGDWAGVVNEVATAGGGRVGDQVWSITARAGKQNETATNICSMTLG
jgi:hypothetical protein